MTGFDVVAVIAVVVQRPVMTPAPVAQAGGDINIDVSFLVTRRILDIERGAGIPLPNRILHQRPGHQELTNGTDIGRDGPPIRHPQQHLTVALRLCQLHGVLNAVAQFDQHRLVAVEGGDARYIDRQRAGKISLQHQLAAFQKGDLASQTITIVEPQGIGDTAPGQHAKTAQQDNTEQRHRSASGRHQVKRAIIHERPANSASVQHASRRRAQGRLFSGTGQYSAWPRYQLRPYCRAGRTRPRRAPGRALAWTAARRHTAALAPRSQQSGKAVTRTGHSKRPGTTRTAGCRRHTGTQ